MYTQTWTFVLLFLVPAFSFPPQTVPSEPHTRTHREITIEGLFRGVAKVLQSNSLVNTSHKDPKQIVRHYFGSDADGFQNFYNVLITLIDHENMIQRYRQEEAYVHVNGEQIFRAHMYLCNIRLRIKTIVQTLPLDRDFLLLSIGQYLYTLQEFYSNTNWVELKGVAINKNLGIASNFGYEVSALSEDTCKNCEKGNCRNNDITDGKLTSGYKSGQNIEKPATRGGINKERYNVKFSPHYYLHQHASEAAVMATDYFISADKTGLVHLTGLDIFLQICQLRRRMKIKMEGYTIAFAILVDTRGSMSDDIKAVIANSVNIVTSLQGSNNEPDNYVLTTFNDPVKVGLRYVTSDGYQMIRQLQGLHADGGGDCPEYALSGTLTGTVDANLIKIRYDR
ncbi:von Willebrand factor A domain-containing protein 7-like [Saccostrea cucullata]|uniref:von Willebrand factor A domain-containing protein 7-like n=1 Tax=Saccostrea cuccullata TaxID=36930 RepID=UPI002ED217F0